MKYQYKTTTGSVNWNERASVVESYDDPEEPPGDGWELVSSVITDCQYSCSNIFWFWRRPVVSEIDPLKP